MQELIGKVRLNLQYYEGKDLYNEGASEDELLDIVMNKTPNEYNNVIKEHKSWSVLYHLSNIRENIISFLPIKKSDSVLEIGSGCGAITGKLADMAGSVTCIELSKKRSLINAYKNKDKDNIEILVGNFQTIEKHLTRKYDYITLIGVFEYAASYIESESDAYSEFMKIVSEHLSENGKLVIAIENQYGMKYFAGCREDHVGMFFEGIEGYGETNLVKTFSREKIIEYAQNAGLQGLRCYYPYPDYKLPMAIYSDDYYPISGELLSIPAFNFDQSRYVLFDEAKALEEAVEQHMFAAFSNSFLFIFEKQRNENDRTVYVKYSNDRSPQYMISTGISRNGETGKLQVFKVPEAVESIQHVKSLYDNYLKLSRESSIYNADSVPDAFKVKYNKCHMDGNKACFEYIQGRSLGQIVCEMYRKEKRYEAEKLISRYVKTLRMLAKNPDVQVSQKFVEVFGDIDIELISPINRKSQNVSDIDFNLDNMFLSENDNVINVIDYEWVFDFNVPIGYILYRAFKYLSINIMGFVEEYKKILLYFCDKYDIPETEALLYENMDEAFGKYVKNGRNILGELNTVIGKDRVVFNDESVNDLLFERERANALKEYCDAYELELSGSRSKEKFYKEYCDAYELELEKKRKELSNLREYCNAYQLELDVSKDKIKDLEELCRAYETELAGIKNSAFGKILLKNKRDINK